MFQNKKVCISIGICLIILFPFNGCGNAGTCHLSNVGRYSSPNSPGYPFVKDKWDIGGGNFLNQSSTSLSGDTFRVTGEFVSRPVYKSSYRNNESITSIILFLGSGLGLILAIRKRNRSD
jgi:hypothetical protein